LCILLLAALVVPYVSKTHYAAMDLHAKNLPPSWSHVFGTDELGRDIGVRLAFGIRISLLIALSAALIDATIGIAVGALAAHFGGKIDQCLMRVCDILQSIP